MSRATTTKEQRYLDCPHCNAQQDGIVLLHYYAVVLLYYYAVKCSLKHTCIVHTVFLNSSVYNVKLQ